MQRAVDSARFAHNGRPGAQVPPQEQGEEAKRSQQYNPHTTPQIDTLPDRNTVQNPKAHAFANPGRFQKQFARSHDVKEKRFHVPLVDRLPEEAPPLVVGVVGPPGVGKSTLIKSLIRRYTKQTLNSPTGPLTVVTGKRRRLTFIECPADSLASMIDIAKVVDIVLLMIDGNYGFEMETMEFLNVLSSSGMPGNVFGILTHLDLFKKQDTLRTRKKQLKHRFWSELYQGAKLFYLSGVVNGRYPDREVLNISRFLSVMKNPRPLVWRNSHPYALADRYLDLTPPTDIEQNPKCDRTIALYGYLRGTNFPAQGAQVHIPGVGDVNVANIEALPDPCPTPHMDQALQKATDKALRRRLGEKQKVLYAPMSDVGGVLVDKDAVYIDVKTPTFDRGDGDIADRGFGEQMVMGLQGDRRLLGQADAGVRLFGDQDHVFEEQSSRRRRPLAVSNGNATVNDVMPEDEAYVSASGSSKEDALEDMDSGKEDGLDDGSMNKDRARFLRANDEDDEDDAGGDVAFADSDSEIGSMSPAEDADQAEDFEDDLDSEEEADNAPAWKTNLAQKAQALHSQRRRPRQTRDLIRLMYDDKLTPHQAVDQWNGRDQELNVRHDEMDDDLFKQRPSRSNGNADEESLMPMYDLAELESRWTDDAIAGLKSRFTSSHPSKREEGEDGADGDDEDAFDGLEDEEDDEGDGDFEDLEGDSTNFPPAASEQKSLEAERAANARKKEELKQRFEEEDRDGFANIANKTSTTNPNQPPTNEFGEDEWYDAQKAQIRTQLDINRAEFDALDSRSRINTEGHKAGTYVRLTLSNIPYEFAATFSPRNPLIIGGLTPTETRFGYLSVRIKRHRWHARILKNNDPLIFSLGWRRFQSIPLYSLSDSRTRNRMLKYTPEHMHCFGTLWGPLAAPNTGFCAVQSLSNATAGFRIAATGVVLSVEQSTQIVKKLKLKGYPHKIYKNTAILKDMFASSLEVMKFQAANLRTVSGIRGMVKGKAGAQYPDGYVRAGFEDKILKSDIVFLSAWRTVKPREFYMPVTNLLLPPTSSSSSTATPAANPTAPTIQPKETTWTGMRPTGAIRASLSLPTPSAPDSAYTPVVRPTRHFNPLRIPRTLSQNLPYTSQAVMMPAQKRETYLAKRAVLAPRGEERRERELVQMLATVRGEKVQKRKEKQEARREPYRKKVAAGLEMKAAREKREKDEYWRREGKKRGRGEDGGGGGGRGGKKRKIK